MVWGEAAVVMSAPEKEIGPTAKVQVEPLDIYFNASLVAQ
jgi:hypothetical protein